MAATLNIHYAGPPEQRQPVKVASALTPLSAVLADACSKFKPPLDPAHFSLVLQKKPVDLGTPFRLANIPNGTRLYLVRKEGAPAPDINPVFLINAQQAAPRPQAAPMSAPAPALAPAAAVVPPQPVPPPSQPVAPTPVPAPAPSLSTSAPVPAAAPTPQPAPQPQPAGPVVTTLMEVDTPAVTAPAHAPGPVSATLPLQPLAAPAASSSGAVASIRNGSGAGPSGSGGVTTAGPAPAPAATAPRRSYALGADRPLLLFTQAALEQATAQAAGTQAGGASARAVLDDQDEAFYEMTPEDYALITRSANQRKRQEESGLKTKAMREAAERARAEAYGSVRLRVHFPGSSNTILQAAFSASETIGQVYDMVARVVDQGLVGQRGPGGSVKHRFYLYTTPPKQVLKDLDGSLYRCQLVPAAHIHFHLDDKAGSSHTGPVLRPEAQALVRDSITPQQAAGEDEDTAVHAAQQAAAAAQAAAAVSAGVAAAAADADGGAAPSQSQGPPPIAVYMGSGAKVPKWMKLGPK